MGGAVAGRSGGAVIPRADRHASPRAAVRPLPDLIAFIWCNEFSCGWRQGDVLGVPLRQTHGVLLPIAMRPLMLARRLIR